MKYYSTNRTVPMASLHEAVVKGLAGDKGLFMPERIKPLPKEFFDTIHTMSFQEIAYHVADAFFGEDIPAADLKTSVTYKGTWADIENAYTPVEGEIRLLSVAVRAATSSRTLSTSTSSS